MSRAGRNDRESFSAEGNVFPVRGAVSRATALFSAENRLPKADWACGTALATTDIA